MSCIRFNTPAQRQQLRESAPTMLTDDEAAVRHPVPAVTASKIRRLRLLAESPDPKIRESVAGSRQAPPELHRALASDRDEGVRAWLARNEACPVDVLRLLSTDECERVRGSVATNDHSPADLVETLGADESVLVRSLVEWRRALVD